MTLDQEIKFVSDSFLESGEFRPLFIFYNETGAYFFPFLGGAFDDSNKDAFAKMAAVLIGAYGCHAYTFIRECWMRTVKYKEGDEIDPVVENKDDRFECLVFVRESRDKSDAVALEIIRGGKRPTLRGSNLLGGAGGFSGRFSGLLDRIEEATDREREIIKKLFPAPIKIKDFS